MSDIRKNPKLDINRIAANSGCINVVPLSAEPTPHTAAKLPVSAEPPRNTFTTGTIFSIGAAVVSEVRALCASMIETSLVVSNIKPSAMARISVTSVAATPRVLNELPTP